MASNTSLVTQITGQAWIRDADGTLRPLQEGMHIPADADIVTGNGASVQLQADDQPALTIGQNRDMQISADVAQDDVDPLTSAATAPAQTDTARVIAALDAGDDPFDELDATAAVLQGGSDGAGGSSFTRLLSIVELTTPLALEYPRPSWPGIEEIRLGGGGSNRSPELTGDAAQLMDQLNDDSDVISGLNVGQYFTDPDGHSLTFSATGLPPGLTIDPNTGIIKGTLDSSASQGGPGSNGVYTVVVTGTDPYGASVSLPFTWTTLNPPPVAADDFATTEENTIVTGNVLTGDPDTGEGRDVDPDGDTLTVIEITNSNDEKVPAGTPISGVNETGGKGGGTFTINPDGSYSFDPGTDFDYLAVGEETTTKVTYEISDGDGGFDTAELSITVTGTNDAPVIVGPGTNAEATIIEVEDGHDDENIITHTKTGTITFSDADDNDEHGVSFEPQGNDYLGKLILGAIDPATGTVTWTFTVDDLAIDHLAKDQELVQEYVITITDKHGAAAEQTVTITIIGTNDAPTINVVETSATGQIKEVEDDADDENTKEHEVTGTIFFDDVDLQDTHTAEVTQSSTTGTAFLGELELHPVNNADSTINWSFTVNDGALDHLAEGEKIEQTYTVTVNDGNGGTTTQDIVITIVGTNDAPEMSGELTGSVKEDAIDSTGQVSTGGKLDKTDVDLIDTHSWYFGTEGTDKAPGTEGLGQFTIDQDGNWIYVLDNNIPQVQELSEGQEITDTIEVTVDDGNGGTDTKTITVTITGTNDDPVAVPDLYDPADDAGKVVESGVKKDDSGNPNTDFAGQGEAKGNVLANDTDVDADDVLSVVRVSNGDEVKDVDSGTVTLTGVYGTLEIDSEGNYTYTLNNDDPDTQRLVAGERVTEVFEYTMSDGLVEKSTSLTIAVYGTNDRPEVLADSKLSGDVIEAGHDAVGNPVAGKASTSGVLKGSDVDAGHTEELTWHLVTADGTVQEGTTQRIETDYGTLALNSTTGLWEYELDDTKEATQKLTQGQTHDEKFTVHVRDPEGAWKDATITVTITGTNDAPELQAQTLNINEDEGRYAENGAIDPAFKGYEGNVLDDAVDPDSELAVISFKIGDDEFSVDPDSSKTVDVKIDGHVIGEFTLGSDGSYTFLPKEHYSGKVPDIEFTVQEQHADGSGLIVSETLKITITPVADAPEIDVADVRTDEDTVVELGLQAPRVVDDTDLNGEPVIGKEDLGDNPELLGVITLSFNYGNDGKGNAPVGAQLLDADGGTIVEISESGTVQIVIIEADGTSSHTKDALDAAASPDSGILQMTQAEYEALQFLPAPDDHRNVTIKIGVDSYEVDASGSPLAGIESAGTEETMLVDVWAVTDGNETQGDKSPFELEFVSGAEQREEITIVEDDDGNQAFHIRSKEDEPYKLSEILDAVFEDLDGSEERWFEISGLEVGSTVTYGEGDKKATIRITEESPIAKIPAHDTDGGAQQPGMSSFPEFSITPPEHWSGSMESVTVTLVAQDHDDDSFVKDEDGENTDTPYVAPKVDDSVTFQFDVDPVAGDVKVPNVTGYEDEPIKFLEKAGLTDVDSSEIITGFVIKGVPEGWIVQDGDGNVVPGFSGVSGPATYVLKADGDGIVNLEGYKEWTITPPAHSSEDITLEVEVSTKDVQVVNGETVTHTDTTTHDLKVTVKPVAEEITYDPENPDDPDNPSWGNEGDDLTMTQGHDYQAGTPGSEDGWFALSIAGDDGFKLGDRWYNADGKLADGTPNPDSADGGTEQTYALLTPELVEGIDGETAEGAMFRYTDGDGKVVELIFNGTDPVEIPMEYLDSVEFMAPEHVAGEFKIKVQAKTVDTDADGGYTDTAISGEAWLEGIVIKPVADGVTLGVQPAQGNEDTPIDLHINPTSVDPSETFEVTISKIPAGAMLTYGDQTFTVDEDGTVRNAADETVGSNSTVVIEDFDAGANLTITPPEHSNENFKLDVEARSVDTVNGETDYSEPQKQTIDVKVKGVADPATIQFEDNVTFTEAELDGHGAPGDGKSIALSELIQSVTMVDDDGSETLSFKLTGFPGDFEISGEGVIFMGGTGEDREWVFSVGELGENETLADVLGKISITVPEHFSGNLPGSIAAITTENDGHSLTGEPQKWDVTITPSPESELTSSTTIDEDTLGKVNFSIADNKGDKNEALTAVWIKADNNENFTLYFGDGGDRMTLADAVDDSASGVVLEDGYYKLTGDAIGNVYAQAKANLAHNTEDAPTLSFGVKYEVTDYAEDDSGLSTTKITDESTHEIKVTPITDPVTLDLGESKTTDVATRGEFTVDFTVSKQPDDQAASEEPVSDYDGSEKFTQIIVDGVPDGMLLTGVTLGQGEGSVLVQNVSFLGKGQWLISIPDSDAARFKGDIDAQLHFKAGALLDNDEYELEVTVVTRDTDAKNTESATETLNVDASLIGEGGGGDPDAAVTVTFEKNEAFTGTEDKPFTLDEAFTATIDQGGTTFTLVLKLPEDSIVKKDGTELQSTQVDGQDVWIITGEGDQGALDAFLKSIEVTPPSDLNDNNGELDTGAMEIDATLTAYLDNGSQSEGNIAENIPLTPVTDGAVIDITFSAAGEDGKPTDDLAQDGRDIAITLKVQDGVDTDSDFGDSVYIQMTDGKGLENGILVDSSGKSLTSITVEDGNDQGLPAGTYYVAALPDGETSVDVRYVPADGQEYTAGSISINAWVQSKEKGADENDWVTARSTATGEREAVNNGYDLNVGEYDSETDTWTVVGSENQTGEATTSAITLTIEGKGLFDTDDSEQVVAAQLNGVPVGFLVYVDGELASNAGGNEQTNNWLIPVSGNTLPEISILPPQHWSGTLEGLELSVLSGEVGQETWGEGATFNLHVEPKADGIASFTPAPAFNDQDGIVHLNLNIAMVDRQYASVVGADDENVETVSLKLSGLGKYAMFLVDGKPYEHVEYNEDGTYTISGLTQKQANELAFVQTGDRVDGTIDVTAWTVDGDDESGVASGTVDLRIIDRGPAAGTDSDDIIVGTAGNETLIGGDGDDIIFGGAGNDTIIGGKGDDILIGGAGNDTFQWMDGDQGDIGTPATDTIMDFGLTSDDPNGNDKLNLADLLQGESYSVDGDGIVTESTLDQYLHFDFTDEGDTLISISSKGEFTDGNFDASKVDQKIILKDVAATDLADAGASQSDIINNLITQGKLIVDSSSS